MNIASLGQRLKQKIFDGFMNAMNTPIPTASRLLSDDQKKIIRQTLQPGDILLETDDACPGWQTVEKLAFGSEWTHAAIYAGDDTVVDSETNGRVERVPLDQFLNVYHIGILRPTYKTTADIQSVFNYVNAHIGEPYDDNYFDLAENGKYTGVKLMYWALKRMPNPIAVPLFHVFGKDVAAPESFIRSPEIRFVWSSGSGYAKNIASHWPVLFGTLLGAAAGAPFGPAGIAGGALLGTAGMIKIGNILQGNS